MSAETPVSELIPFELFRHNDLRGILLLNLVSQLMHDHDRLVRDSAVLNEEGKKCLTVELKINGMPLTLLSVIDRLVECYERTTTRKAAEMFRQKLSKLSDVIGDITKFAKQQGIENLGMTSDDFNS